MRCRRLASLARLLFLLQLLPPAWDDLELTSTSSVKKVTDFWRKAAWLLSEPLAADLIELWVENLLRFAAKPASHKALPRRC